MILRPARAAINAPPVIRPAAKASDRLAVAIPERTRTSVDKSGEFEKFEPRGGVMDGEHLSPDKVKEISKWPNRQEQLSLLMGQILAPGANLVSQLLAPGGALASQIKQKSEE